MNKIYLYNTLSRKKEEFKPIKKSRVLFYQCGPTVYWVQHLGNLRAAVLGDIIRRIFEYDGYKVKYVKNYTDVGHMASDEDEGEDKMDKGAKRENLSPEEIAQKYIKVYEDDARDLNIKNPTFAPLATEHIKEAQEMIAALLDKDFAYATPLAIYFDIFKFPNYTALSGQNLEKNIAGVGKGEITDPAKKNPHDFALWFFRAGTHADALQYWPSPFISPLVKNGDGFPGWHIECSAMAKKYLGETLDIHMGGIEHIPVHHTNEIAQSEAANGVKYVNYWLHNEHLLVNNEKMSKSTGTGFTLAEVKAKSFMPLSLRYLFLSANYRSKQNFTWESLEAAQNGLNGIYNKLKELGDKKGAASSEYKNKFSEFLNDDFNTPGALSVLQEVLKSDLSPKNKLATVLDFDKVLGLNFNEERHTLAINVFDEIKISGQVFTIVYKGDVPEEIKKLAEKRQEARAEKNWPESDRLRKEIEKLGYQIKDTDNGAEIYKK